MKKSLFFLIPALFLFHFSISQVGVGTDLPTAQLEVANINTGLPALEFNTQTTPTGSADGQLSFIGYKIYIFDTSRAEIGTDGKWLSIETSASRFGRNGIQDDVNMRAVANQGSNRSGYLMPYAGTITYILAKSNDNNGAPSRQFSIQVRNGNTTNTITNITTTAS